MSELVHHEARAVNRDEAEIVIVREGRLKYRWSCAVKRGYLDAFTGQAFTPRGARRAALRHARGTRLIGFDRLEREEIRVVARWSTPPVPDRPDTLPVEMLR